MNVNLTYNNKKSVEKILSTSPEKIGNYSDFQNSNLLIHGENFNALKNLLHFGYKNKIDLIYIDPPFSTNNIFTLDKNRARTISNSSNDEVAYTDKLSGDNFLEFLRERLILLRELLSEQGSIYLHIDYKIGHYVKILMDEIFGINNFRNDITRIKCNPKNFDRNAYGNIKDMILFYSKGKNPIWNNPRENFSTEDIFNRFKKIDKLGRRYTTIPIHAPGETKNGQTSMEWKGMLPPKGRHWRCPPYQLDELDKNGMIEWSKTGNPRKIIYADDALKNGKKKQDI